MAGKRCLLRLATHLKVLSLILITPKQSGERGPIRGLSQTTFCPKKSSFVWCHCDYCIPDLKPVNIKLLISAITTGSDQASPTRCCMLLLLLFYVCCSHMPWKWSFEKDHPYSFFSFVFLPVKQNSKCQSSSICVCVWRIIMLNFGWNCP